VQFVAGALDFPVGVAAHAVGPGGELLFVFHAPFGEGEVLLGLVERAASVTSMAEP
jgi:hypothetical protein